MSVACSVRRGRRQPLTPGKHYLMKKSPGSLRASAQRTLTRSLRSRELCSVLLKHTTKKEGKTGWRETFCFSVSSILMLIVSKICYLSGGSLQTKVIVGIIENSVLSHLKGGRLEWKHVNDSDLYGELWETQWRWGWFCNRGSGSSITERLAQTSSDLWKWKITPELSTLSRRSPDLYATFGLLREPVFTAVYLRGELYLQAETYSSCIHWKEEITILESLKPRAPRMNQPACDYKSRCRSRSSKKRCSLTSCPRFKAFLQLLHNAALTYCIYHTNL